MEGEKQPQEKERRRKSSSKAPKERILGHRVKLDGNNRRDKKSCDAQEWLEAEWNNEEKIIHQSIVLNTSKYVVY